MPPEMNEVPEIKDERQMLDEKPEEKQEEKPEEKESEEKEEGETEDLEEISGDEEDEQGEGEEEEEEKDEEDEDAGDDDEEVKSLEHDQIYHELKAKYPKALKEIPGLKTVLFREARFTEIFPTFEDAESAREAAEVFGQYQADLSEGNSKNLIEALEKTDKKALEAFVGNFGPTLQKHSKDLYMGFVSPIFKQMLRAAANSDDERISVAAKNVHYFIFGDTKLDQDAGLKPVAKDEREEKFTKKEQELEARQFQSFMEDTNSVTKKRVLNIIKFPLKDSGISALIQETLAERILQKVDAAISQDKRHMGNIRHLMEGARRAGFTTEWKDRIISAYLSRAKVLTPKIRQQILSEAKLGNVKGSDKSEEKEVKRIPSSGGVQKSGLQKLDPKKVDWNKTSERDLLEGRVTYRK